MNNSANLLLVKQFRFKQVVKHVFKTAKYCKTFGDTWDGEFFVGPQAVQGGSK